jgi:hypothetical protein
MLNRSTSFFLNLLSIHSCDWFPEGRRKPQSNEFQCPVESLSGACLEQEPGTPLRLVNPNFDQAGSSNVLVFLADAMGLAQGAASALLSSELGEHVLWLDV